MGWLRSRQDGNGRLPWVGERPTRMLVPTEGMDTDINNRPSHMHLPRLARVRTLYSRGMAAEQGRGGKPQSEVRRCVRAHPRRRTLTLLKQGVTVMSVNHFGRIDATSSVSKFVGQTCGLRVRFRWPAGGSCSLDRGEATDQGPALRWVQGQAWRAGEVTVSGETDPKEVSETRS